MSQSRHVYPALHRPALPLPSAPHRTAPHLPSPSPRASRLGMTLIEIMIVVTIMASIMAVAGYYIFGMGNQSKIKLADSKTKELVKLIKTYVQSGNKAPANLEEMRKNGFIDEVPADPWGNEYQISIQGKNITVSSYGPDGSSGNEDDIKAEGTTN
jgi:general secretion pathway protein G